MHTKKLSEKLFWTNIPVLMAILVFIMLPKGNGHSQGTETPTPSLSSDAYPPPSGSQSSLSSGPSSAYLPMVSNYIFPYDISTSYYIKDVNNTYTLGYQAGLKAANKTDPHRTFVILDFGYPDYSSPPLVYGVRNFSGQFISLQSVYGSVQQFITGYYDGSGGETQNHMDLGVGFYNANIGALSSPGYRVGHAAAWASCVRLLDEWSLFTYGDVVRVSTAMDIETDPTYFADPAKTRNWISNVVPASEKPFYNFGIADCDEYYPSGNETEVDPMPCGPNGSLWTQEDIYQVSDMSGWGYPFPEIYNTYGSNANQWYRIGLYGNIEHNPDRLVYRGTLTQLMACKQRGCIAEVCNSPEAGFNQMKALVLSDGRLQNEMQWSSDIMWQGEASPYSCP